MHKKLSELGIHNGYDYEIMTAFCYTLGDIGLAPYGLDIADPDGYSKPLKNNVHARYCFCFYFYTGKDSDPSDLIVDQHVNQNWN